MQFTNILFSSLTFISATVAIPTPAEGQYATPVLEVEKRASSGSYSVSGLGTRKKAITAAGGDTLDMATAMLETENMKSDYAYGDNKSRKLRPLPPR